MNRIVINRNTIINALVYSIVPTVIAIVGGAFFIGSLNGRVLTHEGEIDTLKARVNDLRQEWNNIDKKLTDSTQTEVKPSAGLSLSPAPKKRRVDFRNGGPWGKWSEGVFCEPGEYVCGMAQKVESNQKKGDDSAMNAVAFYCCS